MNLDQIWAVNFSFLAKLSSLINTIHVKMALENFSFSLLLIQSTPQHFCYKGKLSDLFKIQPGVLTNFRHILCENAKFEFFA